MLHPFAKKNSTNSTPGTVTTFSTFVWRWKLDYM